MTPRRDPRRLATAWCLGVALATPAIATAQGTARRPAPRPAARAVALRDQQEGRIPQMDLPGAGPVTLPSPAFPGDQAGTPEFGGDLTPEQLDAIDQRLRARARLIDDPGERTLAMIGVARAAIFAEDFADARSAIEEAGEFVVREPNANRRDRRIAVLIAAIVELASAERREAMAARFEGDPTAPLGDGSAANRLDRMRIVIGDYEKAADFAQKMSKPQYRSQTLFVLAQAASTSSSNVAFELSLVDRGRDDLAPDLDALTLVADTLLVRASQFARRADRVAWRDQALATVAANGANSNQFARSLEIARMIPLPEARSGALLSVAEAEARKGSPERATMIYGETARAIASIPIDDLRATLADVLIDSLISAGRYDDARASVVLIPDRNRKIGALSAVAEAMGRRGLATSATAWIEREAAPADRSLLLRRVNDGVLAGLEQYRTSVSVNSPGMSDRP